MFREKVGEGFPEEACGCWRERGGSLREVQVKRCEGPEGRGGPALTGARGDRGGRDQLAARQRGRPGRTRGPLPGRRRRPRRADCTAPAVKRARGVGRAAGRGGGARGGGLAPERRGAGAIKMHPMELPGDKDGTETQPPEEVVKAEEDARAAAAAAGK